MKAIDIAAKSALVIGALFFAQGFASVAAAQTVYKTVDDDGNITFTDRPPLNRPAERVEGLTIAATDDGFLEESEKQQAADNVAAEIREQFENEQAAEEAQMAAAAEKERASNCQRANERLTKYSQAQRLYKTDATGERQYLNDDELDSARSKAARDVAEWCG